MKKCAIIFLFAVLFAANVTADTAINIRGGFLTPAGASTSFMPGISYGINVDDVVELAVGFDFFYRSFSEQREATFDTTKAGNIIDRMEVGTDVKTGYIPLMATLRVGIPVELPVLPYGGVGLGWAILWEDIFIPADKEEGKHTSVEELYFYNGFNWILQAGAKYRLSPNVQFYGETFYNFGKMKKDIEIDEFGRTWDELDMSGLGLRIGIEMTLR